MGSLLSSLSDEPSALGLSSSRIEWDPSTRALLHTEPRHVCRPTQTVAHHK